MTDGDSIVNAVGFGGQAEPTSGAGRDSREVKINISTF